MVDLDTERGDLAGAPLRAVSEIPASPTFIGHAKHFDEKVFSGIKEARGELVGRWFAHLSEKKRAELVALSPSIAWNHAGQRVGRPHPAVWAEAGVVLAATSARARAIPAPILRCGPPRSSPVRSPRSPAGSRVQSSVVTRASLQRRRSSALAKDADFAIVGSTTPPPGGRAGRSTRAPGSPPGAWLGRRRVRLPAWGLAGGHALCRATGARGP